MEKKSETITFSLKGDLPFDVVHYLPHGDGDSAAHRLKHEEKLDELKNALGDAGLGEAVSETRFEERRTREEISQRIRETHRLRNQVGDRT